MADAAPVLPSVATPSGTSTVSEINSARSAAVGTGADPYAGAGATKVSAASVPTTSPTVMTDANIRETTIPQIQADATKLLGSLKDVSTNGFSGQNNNNNGSGTSGSSTVSDITGTPLDPSSPTYFSDLYASLSNNIDNSPDTANELSMLNNMKAANDAASQSSIQSITNAYNDRVNTLQTQQGAQTKSLTNSLLLGGSARYAPVSSSGILSAKEAGDAQAIADLQDKENAAISTAQQAQQNNDYKVLSDQLSIINSIRTEKNTLATTLTADMNTNTKTLQANALQSKRDEAVAAEVANGVTDPETILTTLNTNDPNANYTAAEVETTLKNLSPTADLTGLSGSVKDFFALKGQNKLPSNISSLPDDQQLGAYLKYIKTASTVSSPGSNTKITVATAKSLGLPLSTVGLTQKDITDSLESTTPPAWFIEKLNAQGGAGAGANATSSAWDAFRVPLLGGTPGTKGTSAGGTSTTSPATSTGPVTIYK